MNVEIVVLAAVVGYLLGSISFARIVGRITAPGVDITTTTINVPSTGERYEVRGAPASSLRDRASVPWRLAVVLLDMAKAAVPTFSFQALYPESPAYAAAFAAAVIGHNWPIYHRFLGGFGISSIIGGVAVIDPLALLVTIPIGVVVGKLFLDDLSMINGFALLLPAYFVLIPGNVEAAIASLVVLVAYWAVKRTRLVHVRPGGPGADPGVDSTAGSSTP